MGIKRLRIATRTSPLALWQTNYVKEALNRSFPHLEIELLGIVTTADKMSNTPLIKIGGKGLFVKELETALLENRADIAVHSIKDMPMTLPKGLMLGVVCQREDPRDAFVSNNFRDFDALPQGARIGTSSLRRQVQLLALRKDLSIENLRGNIGTRLNKLDNNEFDAIILAAAGLKRLAEAKRIRDYFDTDIMLPAAGQGAIGIECREDDSEILNIISILEDNNTRICITAERALTAKLGGSCQVPIASYAEMRDHQLWLRGLVGSPTGSTLIRSQKYTTISPEHATMIGHDVADELISQGAKSILQQITNKLSE